jgi:hypothetical protein
MQTITEVYKVYEFSELSDQAKDKAREWARDINVDFDDWYQDEFYFERLTAAGMVYDLKELCFDLDRSDYLYFHKGLSVDDPKKFLKAAGCDLRKKEVRDTLDYDGISINTIHYSGNNGENTVDPRTLDNIDLTDFLNDLLGDIKSDLRKNYYYLIGNEAVDETILANEYTFLEDGTRKG